MARKLKTFRTSLGFYDLAVAAPSMKAALEAWGAGSNLFHQGIATETDDPDVVAATMSKPGVVLKRPAGSNTLRSTPISRPTWDPARAGLSGKDTGRSRRSELLSRSANENPEKPRPTSRRSGNAAKSSAGGKKLPEKGNANGARRRRPKRNRHWTRLSANMTGKQRLSKPRWRPSRNGHAPKMTDGKRKERGCKPRCGVRASRPNETVLRV